MLNTAVPRWFVDLNINKLIRTQNLFQIQKARPVGISQAYISCLFVKSSTAGLFQTITSLRPYISANIEDNPKITPNLP